MNRSARISAYLSLIERLGEPVGDWRAGEVQILTKVASILEHENALATKCVSAGRGPCQAVTGIMYEDQYVWLLRDPVLFPPSAGGTDPVRGTYIRIIYKQNIAGNPSVFLLTAGDDGRLILNRAYRHAIRAWTLEGQGTIAKTGETLDDSIARCVRDEIGMPVAEKVLLSPGYVAERGLLGCQVPMFLVRVRGALPSNVEDPTIAGHAALSGTEYEAALLNGSAAIEGRRHLIHEGYTLSAYLLAKLRTLL
jgi:ADP-ribose pyrophosphatase